MTRKEFYPEYYERTNSFFSNHIVWGKKEDEDAWKKHQGRISKLERKVFIAVQYLLILLCWVPVIIDISLWEVIPIILVLSAINSVLTDFSFIKIEILYRIYKKDNVYCAILYEIFRGDFEPFLKDLNKSTNKVTTGYFRETRGKIYEKYSAFCHDKNKKIVLIFRMNKVVLKLDGKKYVINNKELTKDLLLKEISLLIIEKRTE